MTEARIYPNLAFRELILKSTLETDPDQGVGTHPQIDIKNWTVFGVYREHDFTHSLFVDVLSVYRGHDVTQMLFVDVIIFLLRT